MQRPAPVLRRMSLSVEAENVQNGLIPSSALQPMPSKSSAPPEKARPSRRCAPPEKARPVEGLATFSHTSVKTSGMRALVDTADKRGAVMLVNHGRPTGVLLSVGEYTRLAQLANVAISGMPDPVDALRRRFDERLEILQRRGAPERLDAAFEAPTREMARMCEYPMLAG